MAGEFLGQLLVKINSDTSNLEQGINRSGTALRQFGERARAVGADLTRKLTLPIAAAGAAALKFAIDAEETRSKFNTAFRGIEDTAQEVSESLQEGFGLSSLEAERLLSNTGDLLKGFGASADVALDLSAQVQSLAADLASYNNVQGGTTAASEALTAALLGERERLKSLGIVIRQEDVNQQLLLNGQEDLTGQARLLATAQATLQLAVQQSGDAIGDVARTSDSAANQLRFLKADAIDLAVEVGRELIPAFLEVIEFARNAVGFFAELDEGTKRFILTLAGLAAGIGPAISAIGAFSQSLAFLAANPIVAVLAGVAAVGVGIASLAKTAREAQLAEIAEDFTEIAEEGDVALVAIEAIQDALRLGSQTFNTEFGSSIEDVRRQVESLSDNLGVSVDNVIQIGLQSKQVNDTFKEQLQILFDEREAIRNTGAAYADFAAAQQRSLDEQIAREAELERREQERLELQRQLNEQAALKREEINETFRVRLRELNAVTEIEQIELQRQQALEDAASALVRTGAEIDLINTYYDRQIELIEEAKRLEEERAAEQIERDAAQRLFEQNATQIELLEARRDAEIAAAEAVGAETTAIVEFYTNEINRIREDAAEQERLRLEREEEEARRVAEAKLATERTRLAEEQAERDEINAQRIAGLEELAEAEEVNTVNIERIRQIAHENQLERDRVEAESAARLRDLRIDAALETVDALDDFFSTLADRERERIEANIEDEEQRDELLKQIARREANRKKAIGVLNATVDTARAIIGFLADPGGTVGVGLSIAAGITGAAQIASILAAPIPALAEGGFFNGPALVGEAGPEVAIPLSGSQGQAALGLMADSIVGAIEKRGNTVNNTSNVTLQSNSIFPSFESQDRIREAARMILPALEDEAQRRGTSLFGGA